MNIFGVTLDGWDAVALLVFLISLFILFSMALRKDLDLDPEVARKLRTRAIGGAIAGLAYLGIRFFL